MALSARFVVSLFFNSRIRVDPGLGEIAGKIFRLLRGFEAIHQSAQRMRAALAILFPGDLGARAPLLGASVERGIGDNQTITII